MSSITPPIYVSSVLKRLENSGHSAFLVGGCVRDILMGRHPNDWDICTSALPEEVMSVFSKTRPTGVKHGTVTVIEHGSAVEITTFRSDGEYKDHRRPENVRYIADLQGDLERRDFTINAIAIPLSGEMFDPFGGRDDIQKKLIRCVGDPYRRFNEDALRMLRALRFSAVLDLEIEASTLSAIREKASLAGSLAKERVQTELEKILLSNSPQILSEVIEYGLLGELVTSKTAVPGLAALKTLPKNRAIRWAGFCALLIKGGIISDAEEFLSSLRLDSAAIRSCSAGCRLVIKNAPASRLEWKKLLSKSGIDIARCAAAAADVLYGKGQLTLLNLVICSGECCFRNQLSVSGDDLQKLGFQGTEIGYVLDALLTHVLEFPADNNNSLLIEMAEKLNT